MIDADYQTIIEVINNYFEGTYYADNKKLEAALHVDSRITGLIQDDYFDWTRDAFITRLISQPSAKNKGEKYDKSIISIDISGKAAMVKTRVAVGELIFIDYITLLKIDNRWWIRNKSFST